MIGVTDWAALGGFVGSLGAAIAAVIGALYAGRASRNTATSNGHTLGENSVNIAAAVTTPPHVPSLGQVISDVADQVTTLNGGGTLAAIAERADDRQKTDDAAGSTTP